MMTNDRIRQQLFEWQDLKYRDFHAKLVPDYDKAKVIGVRVPLLKQLAKEIVQAGAESYLQAPPYTKYHEECTLYGLVLGLWQTDINSLLAQLDKWLPCVDTWAICDVGCNMRKTFGSPQHRLRVWQYLNDKLKTTDEPYTIRFVVVTMFVYFNDEEYAERIADIFQRIKSEHYYVKMALAWGVCEVVVKHYELGRRVLQTKMPDKWVQNKAIQKSVESRRLTDEQKTELKSFKL